MTLDMTLETLEQHSAAAGEGLPLLGKTVIWDVPARAVVPIARVRELLDAAGVPASELKLPTVRDGQVLQRALRNLGEAGLVEEVMNRADRVVYQLTSRVRERERDIPQLRYEQRVKLVWYRAGVPDALRHLQNGPDPIIVMSQDGMPVDNATDQQVHALVSRFRQCYTPRDITSHVLVALVQRADGFSLRRGGGCYFVPASGVAVVPQLKAFMAALAAEIGEPCTCYAQTTYDSGTERDDVGGAALAAILADLRKVDIDLGEREAKLDVVQAKTADEKLGRVDAILARAARLARISSLRVAEIEGQAEELRRRALALKQTAEARPQPVTRGRRKVGAEMIAWVEPTTTNTAGNAPQQAPVTRGRRNRGSLELSLPPDAAATPTPPERTRQARAL